MRYEITAAFWFVAAVLGSAASTVCAAETPLAGEVKKPEPSLYLGDCQLMADPGADASLWDLWFKLCLKSKIGSDITFVGGNPEENYWTRYGKIYGGLHLNTWLSVHAQGIARDVIPLGEPVDKRRDDAPTAALPENRERFRDYAVVRLGNPVVHRLRLTAGRMRLPFGIDRSTTTESYKVRENRAYWNTPDYAADLTFDSQNSLQVDVAYGRSSLGKAESSNAGTDTSTSSLVQAVSTRVMYDMSALDGSRLVFSGYGETTGVRRAGLGFIVVSSKGDQTHAEYVRRMTNSKGLSAPHEQLLRLAYLGAWRQDSRISLQIDDDRRRFRMGTLGQDMLLYNHIIMRIGISHYKSENGDNLRRWSLTTGLEAEL